MCGFFIILFLCFVDVEVLKTATVREVKMAVEAAFSHLPITVLGNVSWYNSFLDFEFSI